MLLTPAQRCAITILVTALTVSTAHADAPGQIASQAMLSQTCNGCHGSNGYSVGPAAPSIGGQTKNYLVAALLGYKFYQDPDALDAAVQQLEAQEEFEDIEPHPRYSTIMGRLMQGYTVEEIILIADYYSKPGWKNIKQSTDPKMARSGKKYHKKYCEKCHEDGGTSSDDDVGVLAGQWLPYLQYTLEDYATGRNKMSKKMKGKLEDMIEAHSRTSLDAVAHFYADQ